jgi:hypothetical protein
MPKRKAESKTRKRTPIVDINYDEE